MNPSDVTAWAAALAVVGLAVFCLSLGWLALRSFVFSGKEKPKDKQFAEKLRPR